MELRHLRYFVATAEEEHMGRAAARLRVAQSALSRQLQDLEREVGVLLFERRPRGLRLTEPGRAFLVHARRTLDAADLAVQAARDAEAGGAGRVRVAPPDYGERPQLVAAASARLRAARPRADVVLVPLPWTEHLAALRDGRIDVGFHLGASVAEYGDDVSAVRLGVEPVRHALLPAWHPLAAHDVLTLDALRALPMVLSDRPTIPALHDAILGAVRRAGHEPRIVSASAGAFAGIVQLVAAGAGWVAVADSAARTPPAGTVARPVRELATGCAVELHALRLRAPATPLAAPFVEALLAAAD